MWRNSSVSIPRTIFHGIGVNYLFRFRQYFFNEAEGRPHERWQDWKLGEDLRAPKKVKKKERPVRNQFEILAQLESGNFDEEELPDEVEKPQSIFVPYKERFTEAQVWRPHIFFLLMHQQAPCHASSENRWTRQSPIVHLPCSSM